MGINCCRQIFSEKHDEIQSEPKESKDTSNNEVIIKNTSKIQLGGEFSNCDVIQPVKNKQNVNKPLDQIDTSDYATTLFHILNKFRAKPQMFCNESIKYDLKQYFDEASKNEERPDKPDWSIEKNKQLHDYLTNPQNNDKTSSEKEQEILGLYDGKTTGLFFQSIGLINNLEANIWNLLENNLEEITQILTHNFQTIIIASIPIEGTDKLHSTYVFLLCENSFNLL